jgi:hypothetical protein
VKDWVSKRIRLKGAEGTPSVRAIGGSGRNMLQTIKTFSNWTEKSVRFR